MIPNGINFLMEPIILKVLSHLLTYSLTHLLTYSLTHSLTHSLTQVGGFQPVNRISGENVLMLCSFHNNDITLSQFSVMVTLLQVLSCPTHLLTHSLTYSLTYSLTHSII